MYKITIHNLVGQTYSSVEFETKEEALQHGEYLLNHGLIKSFELDDKEKETY